MYDAGDPGEAAEGNVDEQGGGEAGGEEDGDEGEEDGEEVEEGC